MGRKLTTTTLLAGLAASLVPAMALAQTEPLLPIPPLPAGPEAPTAPGQPLAAGQTVAQRARPEVSPLGLHLGSFFLFPRAEVDELYNDNIFATNKGTRGDFITVLAPSFDLLSNFARHAINLRAGAAIGRYATHSSENYEDGFGAADGRLDVDVNHQFFGGLRVERLHEARTSPDSPGNAAETVKYNTYSANLGFSQTGLRIGYQADVTARRQEYEAVPAVGGGFLPQSDRNLYSYEAALRGTYEFVPNYQGFVRGAINLRDYDHSTAGNPANPNRNSHGYRVDVGARIDLTGVTFAEVFIGYLQQDYRSPQLGGISGFDVGGNLVWNVTQLTSITFNTQRTAQDANSTALNVAGAPTNSPGYLHTIVGINVDHELLRNVLLNGNASYANDDFQNINRTDSTYGVGAGAKYLLNRNLYLGATYNFLHRDSSGSTATNPYTQNIFMLRLSTQL